MAARQPFQLTYAPITKEHLRAIERKHHTLIRNTIEQQLRLEPEIKTKNRKPLTRPFPLAPEADWELRFGPNNRFRVFYEVNQARREVSILVIGVKVGNRLLVSGKEVEL